MIKVIQLETMHIILIVALIGLLVVFKVVKDKQSKAGGQVSEKAGQKKKNKNDAQKSDKSRQAKGDHANSEAEKSDSDSKNIEDQLTQINLSQPVKVSVEEVDPLTEYKVYKEFGYLDKAAESLYAYIQSHQVKNVDILLELSSLYLSLENYEALSDFVRASKNEFTNEQVGEIIRVGLEQDANNLELRVLADEVLSWDVETINTQVLHTDQHENQVIAEKHQAVPTENVVNNTANIQMVAHSATGIEDGKLVVGHGSLQPVTHEELQVISAMLPNDHAVKLMRTFADYTTFTHKFDRSLSKLKNPAAALVDALGLDYQNKNIDAFAHHLWELYNILGKNGQNIKDKMLGWGYSLGNHEVLNRLAMVSNEQEVRDIGREFGYRMQPKSASMNLPLVSDDTGSSLAKSLGRDVNSILQEADAYLMYGQLDEAMQALEQGIKLHKNEPQLYVNLFELYERAESWERLEEFSKRLRTDVHDLPEEVILVMAKLIQKFKNNNIGMVA